MTEAACPCGSERSYATCCGTILAGQPATTAEALMRSRYTACSKADIDHLRATLHPRVAQSFDDASLRSWLANKHWLKLEIVAVRKGGPRDKMGRVSFRALYREAGQDVWHLELSRFEKLKGKWFYVDGKQP